MGQNVTLNISPEFPSSVSYSPAMKLRVTKTVVFSADRLDPLALNRAPLRPSKTQINRSSNQRRGMTGLRPDEALLTNLHPHICV